MATVTLVPASGSITHGATAVRVNVDAATVNDITAYTTSVYPTSPELRYYLTFEMGGAEYGRSYVFTPNSDGDHEFNNYIFPEAGSWTVHLRSTADDSSVANSGAVTVA